MTHRRVYFAAAALALALAPAACDNDELFTPLVPTYAGAAMFQRYVSFGNSITAGFQSFGLNDSVQQRAYPVLMARAMQTAFNYPALTNPGCPPPITFIFSDPPTRVGGLPETSCALRTPNLLRHINNVAFPGADILEVLNSDYGAPQPPASATDVYKLFLLGGKSELQRAREVEPTFVTVWIGNNDALSAILDTSVNAGTVFTDTMTFRTRFTAFMDSVDSFATIQGGLLVGVAQVAAAPYVTQGRAYFAAQTSIPNFTVLANCLDSLVIGPGDTARVGVPFHFGAPLVAQAAGGTPTTLDCSDPHVISVPETVNLFSAVVRYNATIAQAATARGWAYVDPNPVLRAFAADTNLLRPFPHFPPDPAAPDSISINAPFGSALSRDGVHPSTSTQRLIAQVLRDSINARYTAAIPAIP